MAAEIIAGRKSKGASNRMKTSVPSLPTLSNTGTMTCRESFSWDDRRVTHSLRSWPTFNVIRPECKLDNVHHVYN